jgi:hypothetical protein
MDTDAVVEVIDKPYAERNHTLCTHAPGRNGAAASKGYVRNDVHVYLYYINRDLTETESKSKSYSAFFDAFVLTFISA